LRAFFFGPSRVESAPDRPAPDDPSKNPNSDGQTEHVDQTVENVRASSGDEKLVELVQSGQDRAQNETYQTRLPSPDGFYQAVCKTDAETGVQDEMKDFIDQGKGDRQFDVRLGRKKKDKAVIKESREKMFQPGKHRDEPYLRPSILSRPPTSSHRRR
jgi:hypothetical protein